MASDFGAWAAAQLKKLLSMDGVTATDFAGLLIDMARSSCEAELKEYLNDMIPAGTPGSSFQAEFLRRARADFPRVSGTTASAAPKAIGLAPEQTEQKAQPQTSKDGRKGKFSGESKTVHLGQGGEMSLTAVVLPGRRPCKCQASRHKLVANCVSCGRIVCEQEGPGPCLFCGDEVSTNSAVQVRRCGAEPPIANRGSWYVV
jgi:hypothetical protein